ncbi:MAG: heavy-metal-associated domain-containing protein [Acidimicrobiia bacterium]|nr:heavy-metal-associated domain-containing protein [Acidimicrobiia bacterium]
MSPPSPSPHPAISSSKATRSFGRLRRRLRHPHLRHPDRRRCAVLGRSILLARAAAAIDGAPRWARFAYGASGPLIGFLGVVFGPFQTLGSASLRSQAARGSPRRAPNHHHQPHGHAVNHHTGETTMATTSTFQVAGMTCGHCVGSVQAEVSSIDGSPPSMSTSPPAGSPSPPTRLSTPTPIRSAVEEAGYEVVT